MSLSRVWFEAEGRSWLPQRIEAPDRPGAGGALRPGYGDREGFYVGHRCVHGQIARERVTAGGNGGADDGPLIRMNFRHVGGANPLAILALRRLALPATVTY